MSDKNSTSFLRLKLPIYCQTFIGVSHTVLATSMSGLVRAYPEVSEGVLMYLFTITSLTAIIGSFTFSFLITKYTKKNLAIAAMALGCISALIFILFPGKLPLLFAASALAGFVGGCLATSFPLFVNYHFDISERSKVMGTGIGMIQFGRLLIMFLAGFLANIRWNFVYFVYVFMLITLLLNIFLLPQDEVPAKKNASDEGEESYQKRTLLLNTLKSPGAWQLSLVIIVFGFINFTAQSRLSLYVEGNSLGTSSMTGMITAIGCLFGGFVGVLFAHIYRFTSRRTFIIVFLFSGCGFVIPGLFISFGSILAGIILSTIGSVIFLPYLYLRLPKIVDAKAIPIFTAIIPTLMNIGSFISPALMSALASFFIGNKPENIYLFSGILAFCVAAFLIITWKWNRYDNKESEITIDTDTEH